VVDIEYVSEFVVYGKAGVTRVCAVGTNGCVRVLFRLKWSISNFWSFGVVSVR
jgi:hypothetical protein